LSPRSSNIWGVTKIQCKEWLQNGSTASIWASNWSNDELAFDMSWHPDGFSVIYNIEIDFFSDDIFPYQGEEIINQYLLDDVEKALSEWWTRVELAKSWVVTSKWQLRRGLPTDDILYASLAYLYSQRAEMFPLGVTQLLSDDMSVPLSTTKERIRKVREKEFLTSPGKGFNGQGEVTKKAEKLLREARYMK
jgi:hypothetical protein